MEQEWAIRYKNKGPIINFIITYSKEQALKALENMTNSHELELDNNPSIADLRAYEQKYGRR